MRTKEEIREGQKRWRENNRDYQKKWREKNKDKIKQKYIDNREQRLADAKIYYQENIEEKTKYSKARYNILKECNKHMNTDYKKQLKNRSITPSEEEMDIMKKAVDFYVFSFAKVNNSYKQHQIME